MLFYSFFFFFLFFEDQEEEGVKNIEWDCYVSQEEEQGTKLYRALKRGQWSFCHAWVSFYTLKGQNQPHNMARRLMSCPKWGLRFFFLSYLFLFFLYWCNMGNLIDRSLFLLVTCRLIDNDGEGGEVTDGLYIKSKLNDPSRGIYFHSGLPVTRIPDDALSCGLHSTCICTFLRVWTCFIQINKLIILVIRF